MIQSLDHIQMAHPEGAEDVMRRFYCDLLAMTEVPKPAALQGRGGFWAMAGNLQVHFGVDPAFTPATKAHPAFIIADIEALVARFEEAGHSYQWDNALPEVQRFFAADPVGNRIEFIAQKA